MAPFTVEPRTAPLHDRSSDRVRTGTVDGDRGPKVVITVSRPDGPAVPAHSDELLQLVLSTPSVQEHLDELAGLAAGVSGAIAGCGVTLRRDGNVLTVATSNAFAAAVDEVQYGLGTGPCLQTLESGQVVEVADMRTEQRWDGYPAHALVHGVLSSLSVPLVVAGSTVGALNSYATGAGVFAATAGGGMRRQLLDFAARAQVALALVLRAAQQSDVVEQLHAAMQTRSVIDQALGILMARQRCTAAEAFAVLRGASQSRNRKLVDIATGLITATTGAPPAPGRFEA